VLTDGLSTERKQTILSVLYTIYKPNLSEIDKDVIVQSLTAYYKKHSENHSFNSYYEFIKQWVPDLVRKEGLLFNCGEFFFILGKYYQGGEYDYLLNKAMQTDEFFQCPFIVFELDNIKDHPIIFPVATLIIIDIFLQKMRRLKGTRKVICIEEAWKAIATPQMADYIKYFFKTIRKFFGEALVVTQEIEDILSSPIIKDAIINNADTKILLDMRKFANKFDTISQVLGLSEFQKHQILSVNNNLPANRKLKECFIGLGSYSRVFAVEVSRQEYYCYTSEEKEKEHIKEQLPYHDSFIGFLEAFSDPQMHFPSYKLFASASLRLFFLVIKIINYENHPHHHFINRLSHFKQQSDQCPGTRNRCGSRHPARSPLDTGKRHLKQDELVQCADQSPERRY
jgi:conjugation system TraG family ATPase